jgi:MFS family permease
MFIGMAFGSIFSGFLTQKGRRLSIVISLYALLFGTLFSFLNYITLFIVLRAIIGFGLGVIIPMANNIVVESLSTYCRSFWITFISSFFFFGAIYTCLTMHYIYINEWENPYPLRFFSSLSVPILLTLLMVYFSLDESPRLLLTKRRYDIAFATLERISEEKLSEDRKDTIIKEIAKENKSLDLSIRSIFSVGLKRTSLSLGLIWLSYSFIVNGGLFQFMAGLLYSSSLSPEYLNKNYYVYVFALVIFYLLFIVTNILSGLISEIMFIGRRGLITFGFFCSLLACILRLISAINPILEFLPAAIFVNMSMQITNVYTCEIYPTKIRDIAVGFFYFISRMTGFFANVLVLVLLEKHFMKIDIYFNLLISFIGLVASLRLPVDTYRRSLDTKIENKATNRSQFVNENVTNLDEEIIV